MEQFELIMSYITTTFIAIVGIITYVIKLINKTHELKKTKDKELALIEMLNLIEEAERLFDEGYERKKFVLARLKNFGVDNKIKINMNEFETELNRLIVFSKQVNYTNKGESA